MMKMIIYANTVISLRKKEIFNEKGTLISSNSVQVICLILALMSF